MERGIRCSGGLEGGSWREEERKGRWRDSSISCSGGEVKGGEGYGEESQSKWRDLNDVRCSELGLREERASEGEG